jgi:hypothetical protein
MLTLSDPRGVRHCQGLSRRDFLRIGALSGGIMGAGGLNLSDLLAADAASGQAGSITTGKSVVLLFLQGGPPQIEFFDPKMSAPSEFRSITGEVATRLPGVTFGGTFEQLATRTDRFSIVRSYGSKNAAHKYDPVVAAGNPFKAAMSAIYARLAGSNHPTSGMPTNVLVLPEAVREGLKLESNFETGDMYTLTTPGDLGPVYGAFNPSGGGDLQKNMQLRITPERFADRRSLLTDLDRMRRQADSSGALVGVDRFQQQAFDVITRGVASAFDLSKEDPRSLARYDTSRIFRMEELQRYYDMRRVSNLLGRQMLLARRLCEAGCGFVTVSDCGWDMHANGNSPKGMAGVWPMSRQVDHAVSAFLDDVHERGLSDRILLVVTGEMGRTPRINRDGGRDHYSDLTPLLMAGGGLNMGQVIGQTDSQAARPLTTPYTPAHLMNTVLRTLFDVGKLRLRAEVPTGLLKLVADGSPIQELVG